MVKSVTSTTAETTDMLKVSYISDRVEATKGKLRYPSIAIQLKNISLYLLTYNPLLFIYFAVDVAIFRFRFRVCIDFILSLKSYSESLINTTVQLQRKRPASDAANLSDIETTDMKFEVNLTVIKPEILLMSDPTCKNSPYVKCVVSMKCLRSLHVHCKYQDDKHMLYVINSLQ